MVAFSMYHHKHINSVLVRCFVVYPGSYCSSSVPPRKLTFPCSFLCVNGSRISAERSLLDGRPHVPGLRDWTGSRSAVAANDQHKQRRLAGSFLQCICAIPKPCKATPFSYLILCSLTAGPTCHWLGLVLPPVQNILEAAPSALPGPTISRCG
jgi:hypothetical protein